MHKTHRHIIGVVAALTTFAVTSSAARPTSIDAAFQKFWEARDPDQAGKVADEVVQSGVGFDAALARLREGRSYSANVPRGIVRLSRRDSDGEFFYALNVPDNYDPSRRYQVRFQLHGGTGGRQTNEPRGDGSIGALAGAEQIYVIPYAWREAPWWGEIQLDNLRGILDSVKRSYNVDENRVAMAGVSDGATGSYYFAMRDATPYASFLPLNGFLLVLSSQGLALPRALYPNNMKNRPFFVVNGGLDPLYPTSIVEPSLNLLQASGVTMEYHPQPAAAHNTRWWPEMKDRFESFVRARPRDPQPARLTWQTAANDHANRVHWLVIDRVRASREPALPQDLDDLSSPLGQDRPSGRVDLVRTGNTVEATTRGVEEFTLLLSPDAFDFAQPVKVVANGRPVFQGRVEKSVAALMKWAARDNDRTMLFGAELRIKLP